MTRTPSSGGLLIGIKKRSGGGSVLRCLRRDGTSTWQRIEGDKALFFPLHDLTHYAVESELGFRSGFFGLIAQGWDIEDTTGKGSRGPLPTEAALVETIVGILDTERASRVPFAAAQVNAHLQAALAPSGRKPPRSFTEEELARVRARTRELFREWSSLPEGETLELLLEI